jgi:hypothetical protein
MQQTSAGNIRRKIKKIYCITGARVVFHSRDVCIYMCAFSDVFRLILPVLRIRIWDPRAFLTRNPGFNFFFGFLKQILYFFVNGLKFFSEHVQNKIFSIL